MQVVGALMRSKIKEFSLVYCVCGVRKRIMCWDPYSVRFGTGCL